VIDRRVFVRCAALAALAAPLVVEAPAERLLIELIAANPTQAPELMRMAKVIGFRTSATG